MARIKLKLSVARALWTRASAWVWTPVMARAVCAIAAFVALAWVGASATALELPVAPFELKAEHPSSLGMTSKPRVSGLDVAGKPPTIGPAAHAADPARARDDSDAGSRRAKTKQVPTRPIALNSATAEQLRTLPGIGKKRARAIVELRAKLGRFRRVEQLLRVRGIGFRSLRRLKKHVVVDPPKP